MSYQHLENQLTKVKLDHNWMTHNILNKAFRKYQLVIDQKHGSKSPSGLDNVPKIVGMKKSDSLLSELSNVSSTAKSKSTEKSVGIFFLKENR